MDLGKILKSEGVVSAITICMLLSSYIFAVAYKTSITETGEVSAVTNIFMFLTVFFLFLFLITFISFIISILKVEEIRKIFFDPAEISGMSIAMLLCLYLSTVMDNFTGDVFGYSSPIAQIFFYLALVFLVFFVITFIAVLVSFYNKLLYKKV